ncbi:hypothetical protein TSAR_006568, partial [Trichomalopsis sarcophagae]
DCDITQLSAENRSECTDICVSTPRARERRLQSVRVDPLWRMLIGLPRSLSSKFHNCVNRYRDFAKRHAVPFCIVTYSLAATTYSKVLRRCLLVLVFGAC